MDPKNRIPAADPAEEIPDAGQHVGMILLLGTMSLLAILILGEFLARTFR